MIKEKTERRFAKLCVFFSAKCPRIQEIKFSCPSLTDDASFPLITSDLIEKLPPTLTKLNLLNCSLQSDTLSPLASRVPSLVELQVNGNYSSQRLALSQLPSSLTRLSLINNLIGPHSLAEFPPMPSLTALNVIKNWDLNSPSIGSWQLRELNINYTNIPNSGYIM